MKLAKQLLFFFSLLLFHQPLYGQCDPPSSIPPQCIFDLGFNEIRLHSDGNYSWTFQGNGANFDGCNASGRCFKAILYRPILEQEWSLTFDYVYSLFNDFSYTVRGLKPCTTYQFRITCGNCYGFVGAPGDECFDILCTQIQKGDLSQIFTKTMPSPNVAENIQIRPTSATDVEICWDPIPDAVDHQIFLRAPFEDPPNSCFISSSTVSNCVTLDLSTEPACVICAEFEVLIRPVFRCNAAASNSSIIGTTTRDTFPMGDCTARIINIEPDNHSALVEWEVLFGNPSEFELEWRDGNGTLIGQATVPSTIFTIPDLEANTEYEVTLTPVCGSGCELGDTDPFKTTCETMEPNDTENQASFVPYNVEILSYMKPGDVDYFKFIPQCEFIQIESSIDHALYKEGDYVHPTSGCENFNTCSDNYYQVTPGEVYFIKFGTPQTVCYTFIVKPFECDDCSLEIRGPTVITLQGPPVIERYRFSFNNDQTTWSVQGPAEIHKINGGPFSYVELLFYAPGTVTLTAEIRDCEGNITLAELIIEVIGESDCTCGPLESIFLGPFLPNPSGPCSRTLSTSEVDCAETIFHWTLVYNYFDGTTVTRTHTTTTNTLTIYDDGSECYEVEASVYADCNPGQTGTVSRNFFICWTTHGCLGHPTIPNGGYAQYGQQEMIHLYPNPARDELKINWYDIDISAMHIYDLNGRIIGKYQLEEGRTIHQLNLTDYQPGVYLLRLFDKNGAQFIKKFSVMR